MILNAMHYFEKDFDFHTVSLWALRYTMLEEERRVKDNQLPVDKRMFFGVWGNYIAYHLLEKNSRSNLSPEEEKEILSD